MSRALHFGRRCRPVVDIGGVLVVELPAGESIVPEPMCHDAAACERERARRRVAAPPADGDSDRNATP